MFKKLLVLYLGRDVGNRVASFNGLAKPASG